MAKVLVPSSKPPVDRGKPLVVNFTVPNVKEHSVVVEVGEAGIMMLTIMMLTIFISCNRMCVPARQPLRATVRVAHRQSARRVPSCKLRHRPTTGHRQAAVQPRPPPPSSLGSAECYSVRGGLRGRKGAEPQPKGAVGLTCRAEPATGLASG
jgi:hypothetical protein